MQYKVSKYKIASMQDCLNRAKNILYAYDVKHWIVFLQLEKQPVKI